MAISIKPEELAVMIQTNRDILDMKVPMRDDLKIHFMERRRAILQNFRSQALGMTTVLQAIHDDGSDEGLVKTRAMVEEYQNWVLDEVAKLDQLNT
ncbi:hypothetical protein GTP45_27420 [Pseudoduganella sp. FT55W]|uniref:Uncharacterized protein n=1 Tax=Duganella rivi TaxID=2666083 RepID=A0A7X4GVK9_9BURK|nr:hypothetical protein [Duganella rivi]MYM70512.1 hypothetical protein [Duganella rivi]